MSTMHGNPASHERPGGYFVRRAIVHPPGGGVWTVANFRTADWFGLCAQLTAAQVVEAYARGEAKRFTIRLRGAVAGQEVRVAEEDNEPALGGNWNSCDFNAPILQTDWDNRHGVSRIYWQRIAGTETVEVELWFDIPPA